jgi:biopolymer transport protein ExbB
MAVSWFIWDNSPEYLKQGGPLLVLGLTLLFLVLTFCIERWIVLWRAGGRGNAAAFIRNMRASIREGDIPGATESCKKQGGSLANVVGAGLQRYQSVRGPTEEKEALKETRQAIEEAHSLETPLLERNLSALATLASIATLLGLLGTTVGMIRAFRAMSQAGAPDATQLALGISEALVNTAMGLTTAIVGTVLYNYFTSRVDSFNNAIEQTTYEVLQILEHRDS